MVQSDQPDTKFHQLSDTEKKLLSEDTSEYMAWLDQQKTEGKLHEGKNKKTSALKLCKANARVYSC